MSFCNGEERKPKPPPKPKPKPKPNPAPHLNCNKNCCYQKEPDKEENRYNRRELVQDKICCDFTVLVGEKKTVIYYTNTYQCGYFVASGTIKNCSYDATLSIEFVRDTDENPESGGKVIKTITIPPEGCFSFTLTDFDTIRGNSYHLDGFVSHGEICIVPHFRL